MNPPPGKWTAGILVSVGIFIALLDTTIVDIVLPKMMSSLEADLYGIQWVVIIYFVGAVIAMTGAAWGAQRVGPLRFYLAGLALFVVSSALCGAAWNLPSMLTSRFLQGLGEGIIVPVGLIILYEVFPPEERGAAMGLYGLAGSFAPALGPALGGLLTEHFNWRWVFYVNLPVGLVDALLIVLLVREIHLAGDSRRFDVLGFGLVGTALSALIVLLGKGQELGWLNSDGIVILLVITLVTAAAGALRLGLARHPLFPRRMFSERLFRLGLLAMFFLSINAYGFFLLLPVFLQRLRGLTTLQAGLILLPGSVLTALSTLASGLACDRYDVRKVGIFFLAATALASWSFGTDPDSPLSKLVFDYMLWGFAVGGTFAPVTLLALHPLRDEETGDGATVVNVVRLVAGSVGTALSTALLSAKADLFEAATRHFLEPGRPALSRLTEVLAGPESGVYREDLIHKAAFLGKVLVRRQVTGWAFDAVYDVLALFMALGVVVLLGAIGVRDHRKQITH